MHPIFDTLSTLGIAALAVGLSVTAFAHTETKDPTAGWFNGTYQRGFEERFETSVPAHSNAVELWAATKWMLFNEPATGAIASKDGWLFTAEEFTEPEVSRDLAAELTKVKTALAKDGITLVPVVVPDKARMNAGRLERGRSPGFSTRYDIAMETIEDAGLIGIDLRDALRFDASFMRTDTHWSPEGARRAAETISEALSDLQIPRSLVETVLTGTEKFDGDLLAFVATGVFREQVGPAPELIDTFETTVASNGGLFDDTSIPVALVGTSFSAKPAFHFEGFLKQALQADVLNVSRVGQGPFKPMDLFLNDIRTISNLPSIVIWEIPERFLTSRSKHL